MMLSTNIPFAQSGKISDLVYLGGAQGSLAKEVGDMPHREAERNTTTKTRAKKASVLFCSPDAATSATPFSFIWRATPDNKIRQVLP